MQTLTTKWAVCVYVCICVWVREREKQTEAQQGQFILSLSLTCSSGQSHSQQTACVCVCGSLPWLLILNIKQLLPPNCASLNILVLPCMFCVHATDATCYKPHSDIWGYMIFHLIQNREEHNWQLSSFCNYNMVQAGFWYCGSAPQ